MGATGLTRHHREVPADEPTRPVSGRAADLHSLVSPELAVALDYEDAFSSDEKTRWPGGQQISREGARSTGHRGTALGLQPQLV